MKYVQYVFFIVVVTLLMLGLYTFEKYIFLYAMDSIFGSEISKLLFFMFLNVVVNPILTFLIVKVLKIAHRPWKFDSLYQKEKI